MGKDAGSGGRRSRHGAAMAVVSSDRHGASAPREVTDVIVPAHNEEAVIGRTLRALLGSAAPGEFEVLVVCNGCTDRTAALVRSEFPSVRVLERSEASKTAYRIIGGNSLVGSI